MNLIDLFEKLFGIKLHNTGKFIFNFSIILFCGLCFWLIPKLSDQESLILKKKWNASNYSGIVDSIVSDHSNHGCTVIIFENGEKIDNLPRVYFHQIKKYDSIFKLKYNDTVYAKREKKVFRIEN